MEIFATFVIYEPNTIAHFAFFPNLFHITQKTIHQLSDPKNLKIILYVILVQQHWEIELVNESQLGKVQMKWVPLNLA